MKSKRRHLAIVLVGIGLATGVGSGVWLVPEWRFRSEFRQARRAVQEQRYGEAGALLARLARRWPESGEVAYWLGNCKMIEGRNDEALKAWDRVADGARELPLAAMSRARLAIELCRYGLAEHSLKRAVRAGGESSDEAWQLLSRVYWITGRRDEYRRLLMRDAERTNDPSRILLTLWSLDHDPFQVEGISQALEKAKQSAPDDDRVWLALADLTTRTSGVSKKADRWLKRCEQSRGRMTRQSGRPDWNGLARPPAGPMNSCVPRVICRQRALRRQAYSSSNRGWRPRAVTLKRRASRPRQASCRRTGRS